MSHRKHHVWAMMPLLGILLMSPQDVESRFGRSIASQEPAPVSQERPASSTPKLDALLSGVEIPARQNPVNLNGGMLKEEISSLLSRVDAAESSYQRETVQQPKLVEVKNEIKTSAIELEQVENSIGDLLNPEDGDEIRARISEAKIRLEASLVDLEESEALVARRDSGSEGPERAPSVVEATPEPETTAPSTTPTSPTTAATEEPKKEEKDPVLCALEEQNKLLKDQLQLFVQQQGLIMQQLMQLSQMVMLQGMYRTPDTFNYAQLYQYQQPQTPWVYSYGMQPQQPQQPQMPQGQQPSIFSGQQYPQYPQYPMLGGYGMGAYGMGGSYGIQQPQNFGMPQQGAQGGQSGQWGLAPQVGFSQQPGSLGDGGLGGMGFNFGSPASGMMF